MRLLQLAPQALPLQPLLFPLPLLLPALPHPAVELQPPAVRGQPQQTAWAVAWGASVVTAEGRVGQEVRQGLLMWGFGCLLRARSACVYLPLRGHGCCYCLLLRLL